MPFKQFLQKYGAALDQEMRAVVGSVSDAPPDFDAMLQYPLGWVDAHGNPVQINTGKRIRPIVLLLCAEANGGDWQTALPAAAAVEILHNFSLVHDDIQDASDTRHNRPTVWRAWGQPLAINVGDALFALSYRAISQVNIAPQDALTVLQIYNRTILELTRGQHLDMRFEQQATVTPAEYLSMIRGKTAALLAACAEIGAYIGNPNPQVAAHYADFGLAIGIAFQIRDDILGIWGTSEQTGKSVASDILTKKKSLPVLYGLQQSAALRQLYEQTTLSLVDVEQAVNLLNTVDARTYAESEEAKYYQAAMDALTRANPQSPAAQQLQQLVDALFERAH